MRLKSLQKRLEKIYESDNADFGGQYLWCKGCPHCGVVPYIEVAYCKASKEQRAKDFICATEYKKWEEKIKGAMK